MKTTINFPRLAAAIALVLAVALAATSAQAEVINVDFNNTGGATYSGQGAVSDVGNDLWNGFELGLSSAHTDPIGDPDGPVTSALLLESDGLTLSDVTVTIDNGYVADSSAFGVFATFAPDLFNDSVYEWGAVPITFSIDGLVDGGLYDIYLYSDGNGWRNWGAYAGRFTIDGVTQDANPVYAPAAFVEGENYVLFSDVAAAGGTITGTVDEVPFRIVDEVPFGNEEGELEWHGLTIVGDFAAIPEPSTIMLMLVGAAFLFVSRLWRR